MQDWDERVSTLLDRLTTAGIDLIEWEKLLLMRLGVPLVTDSVGQALFPIFYRDGMTDMWHWQYFFLIPDEQLPTACDIAANEGLYPADEESLRPSYGPEFSGRGIRYIIDDTTIPNPVHTRWRRLVFLPLSWSGITLDELQRAKMANPLDSKPPYTIWMVPLAATCAAYLRIIAREPLQSQLRRECIVDMASLVAYSFFDMSYEGDYAEIPPDDAPLPNEEILEMENAAREVGAWKMREGEEWIKEHLVKIVSAKASYDDLPHSMMLE